MSSSVSPSGGGRAWRCSGGSVTTVGTPTPTGPDPWALGGGGIGNGRLPETEEEYVEFYQDRIVTSQNRQLLPLQEDLADWINKTLGKSHKIDSTKHLRISEKYVDIYSVQSFSELLFSLVQMYLLFKWP